MAAGCVTLQHTDLQGLCRERLHHPPHVQDELPHVFPDLPAVEDEGVGHSSVGLLGHMVGCCSGLLLVLGLKAQFP